MTLGGHKTGELQMKALGFVAMIVLVCLAGVARADVAGNFISNGSFDTDLSGWNVYTSSGGTVLHDTQSPDGGNALSAISVTGQVEYVELEQQTPHVLVTGETLHVSFDTGSLLGDLADSALPQSLALYSNDGTKFTTIAGWQFTTAEMNSGLKTYTEDFTVGSLGAGGTLYVGFESLSPGHLLYDNVSITTPTATPEPGAVTLVITGLLSLLAYAWRKRK
jgi:hypothetical protein